MGILDLNTRLSELDPTQSPEEIMKTIQEAKRLVPGATDEQIYQMAAAGSKGHKIIPPVEPTEPTPPTATPQQIAAPATATPPVDRSAEIQARLMKQYEDELNTKPPEPTSTGENIMRVTGQGMAGLGDALARSYGGQNTNFLEKTQAGQAAMDAADAEKRKQRQELLMKGIEASRKTSKDLAWEGIEKDKLESKEKMDRERLDQQMKIARMKPPPESAIDKARAKALVESEMGLAETKANTESAFGEIDRILALNEESYGGLAGGLKYKALSASNSGEGDKKFENTADIVNTLKNRVVDILKSSFGGQLSDAEREYMDSVVGAAPYMSQYERKVAIEALKRKFEKILSAKEAAWAQAGGVERPAKPAVVAPVVPVVPSAGDLTPGTTVQAPAKKFKRVGGKLVAA